MIVVDANLLLFAAVTGFKEHVAARAWWESALTGPVEVALTPPAVFAFLRVSTNPRIIEPPVAVDRACDLVEDWLAQPRVEYLPPGRRHLSVALELLRGLGTGSNLTTDVQLAAHAIEHDADLYSHDTDFARFPGLRWVDPLS